MDGLTINGQTWRIEWNGRVAATHTLDQSFVTVLKREKTYITDHGSVKETVTVTETSPLT